MLIDKWQSETYLVDAVSVTHAEELVTKDFEGAGLEFEVKSSWVDLLQLVLITVIGAYFGGRVC